MTKYTLDLLRPIVQSSTSLAEVMRKLGFKSHSGGHANWIRSRIDGLGIDRSHFTGYRTRLGLKATNRTSPQEVLVKGDKRGRTEQLRRCMLELGKNYHCEICALPPQWNNRELTLQIDHINGDPTDNRIENLRFVCPNCHTQTGSWGKTKSDAYGN